MRIGIGIGVGYGSARIPSPIDLLGAKTLQWVESDLGVLDAGDAPASNGERVKTWQDRVATPAHYVQATAANQLVFSASGGPNDQPYLNTVDYGSGKGQITLSKAAAGGSGTETLNLYGATVYALDRTQVP
jgi:hypothetical protein